MAELFTVRDWYATLCSSDFAAGAAGFQGNTNSRHDTNETARWSEVLLPFARAICMCPERLGESPAGPACAAVVCVDIDGGFSVTFQPRPPRFLRPFAALAAGLVLLAGCETNTAVPGSTATRVFAADFAGAAKNCIAPKPALKDSEMAEVPIKMGNDGGWCGVTVARTAAKPFDAGLLTKRPEHGRVFIHTVGDATRIDYTPDRGYVGADSFTVRLLPGDPSVAAKVTIAP